MRYKYRRMLAHLILYRKVVMSNAKDCTILYWEVATGARINHASMVRDMEWDQWTCPLGWSVSGIWDPDYDQTDINAVTTTRRGDVCAIGDDYGMVKLLRYPSVVPEAQSKAYTGHSSHVTCVRFTCDDSMLVSTGGMDTALMQWRYHASDTLEPGDLKNFAKMRDHTSALSKLQTIFLMWSMEELGECKTNPDVGPD